jgi:DNA (cytosine-5)-methyltransferase 1
LAKHWPDVPRYKDVKNVGEHNLEPVDLICGGFPCQPVSIAGKRKGKEDSRWLWPEFYRIICELRPKWVLVENVPGLLSMDYGRLFAGILRDLAKGGYGAEWDCIPAAAVGAPHLRYRVFIVAYTDSTRGRGIFKRELQSDIGASSQDVSNTLDTGSRTPSGIFDQFRETEVKERGYYPQSGTSRCSQEVTHTSKQGLERQRVFASRTGEELNNLGNNSWWTVEPDVGRVANGVPSRMDRLKCLGNAVVPQVAEWIGKRIMESSL